MTYFSSHTSCSNIAIVTQSFIPLNMLHSFGNDSPSGCLLQQPAGPACYNHRYNHRPDCTTGWQIRISWKFNKLSTQGSALSIKHHWSTGQVENKFYLSSFTLPVQGVKRSVYSAVFCWKLLVLVHWTNELSKCYLSNIKFYLSGTRAVLMQSPARLEKCLAPSRVCSKSVDYA